jgi:hypothetical protein
MAETTFRGKVRATRGFEVITQVAGVDTVVTAFGTGTTPTTMAVGSGITGTGTIVRSSVTKSGSLIETRILIDLTGLNGGGTAADIIGGNGLANCHFGQITAATNGTIFSGYMRCLEVPTGSNADVDLYAATVATGVEDAAATSLTGQAILLNGGTWTLGLSTPIVTFPAANSYLYLASGTATDATFTAGIFEIVLFGA